MNVSDPQVSPDGAIAVVSAESVFVDNDERTPEQVADLRAALPAGIDLAGTSPMMSDIADVLAVRLWAVIAFVVATSMLLLLVMFRSVWIPVKAAAMNLLSVAAAYGVVTAVFQWGWGLELLGVDHTRPVSTWLPILMFAILFGLSMDYEVFLLSRVREDYERTGDPQGSVARGLAATGTVITAAAAIMVAVFLGFVTESTTIIKMLGFGMACRDLPGRDAGPDDPGAGDDEPARAPQLVAARPGWTGCSPASRPSSPRGAGAGARSVRRPAAGEPRPRRHLRRRGRGSSA